MKCQWRRRSIHSVLWRITKNFQGQMFKKAHEILITYMWRTIAVKATEKALSVTKSLLRGRLVTQIFLYFSCELTQTKTVLGPKLPSDMFHKKQKTSHATVPLRACLSYRRPYLLLSVDNLSRLYIRSHFSFFVKMHLRVFLGSIHGNNKFYTAYISKELFKLKLYNNRA